MKPIISTVREYRLSVGLSQSKLAARVGVSRQALSAIEAGRQVPSTALALQLARVLSCRVDDLFRLVHKPVVEAILASKPCKTSRVVLGRVDGKIIAHPLHNDSQTADGVLMGEVSDDQVLVELFCPLDDIETNVLVAGCAPLLGVLADRSKRTTDTRVVWIPANTSKALQLLELGLVHSAGMHLATTDDLQAHITATQRVCPHEEATLVNLACWTQGLVVQGGNPLQLSSTTDLLRPGLRVVQRDEGAAAQTLLKSLVHDVGGDSKTLSSTSPVASGHAEVAQLVRWGVADIGVTIEAAAHSEGLEVIPVAEERFDLIVPNNRLHTRGVSSFLDLVRDATFRAEVSCVRGYNVDHIGETVSVSPPSKGFS